MNQVQNVDIDSHISKLHWKEKVYKINQIYKALYLSARQSDLPQPFFRITLNLHLVFCNKKKKLPQNCPCPASVICWSYAGPGTTVTHLPAVSCHNPSVNKANTAAAKCLLQFLIQQVYRYFVSCQPFPRPSSKGKPANSQFHHIQIHALLMQMCCNRLLISLASQHNCLSHILAKL